jgi:hypothetical protein
MKVSGPPHTPAALPLRKGPPVPIGDDTGWTPESVWTLWSREKSLAPARNQTPAIQPVTIPTELIPLISSHHSVGQLLQLHNSFSNFIQCFKGVGICSEQCSVLIKIHRCLKIISAACSMSHILATINLVLLKCFLSWWIVTNVIIQKLQMKQWLCSAYCSFHAGFLISLPFDPEDGSDMFL